MPCMRVHTALMHTQTRFHVTAILPILESGPHPPNPEHTMSKTIAAPSLLLATTLSLLLSACSAMPATGGSGSANGRTIADGSSFAMQPGETVTLSDRSTLRYVSVVSDSRCRPDVQCIHAGNAVLGFESRAAGGSVQSFELNSPDQPRSRNLGSRQVTLESLSFDAAPRAQLKVEGGN